MAEDDSRTADTRRGLISRRAFLKNGVLTVGATTLLGGQEIVTADDLHSPWPRYVLRREVDELFLELTAVGYRETQFPHRSLRPVKGFKDPYLVFTLPAQHFAETTLNVSKLPTSVSDESLSAIALVPSMKARLVFKPVREKNIRLTLEELLAWQNLLLVSPDLDTVGAKYDLGVADDAAHPFTRIEMPWGIELAPLGIYVSAADTSAKKQLQHFRWEHSIDPKVSDGWAELWSTALENDSHTNPQTFFEVLAVRGFTRGKQTGDVEKGTLAVSYQDDQADLIPDWLGYAQAPNYGAALQNLDRIRIAATLSRRFPYTGNPGQPQTPSRPAKPSIDTAIIKYDSRFNPNNKDVKACFEPGRTLPVDQYRLSARGGSLELAAKWKAQSGCGDLDAWSHSTVLGRDRRVLTSERGFLYPFGVEAEFLVVSEIAFVRDTRGHFVAVLMKQSFLQIPQPNQVDLSHLETPFRSLSITTAVTPPLDLPPETGNPSTYNDYDYFLPIVDSQPFEFEHVGIDWAGGKQTSKMPMFFVSDHTRFTNGLIWEPGYTNDWKPNRNPSKKNSIPVDGAGLRDLDAKWMALPHRFTNYGDSLIALANPTASGNTSQRVEWVEWVRGSAFQLPLGQIADRPFQPRARTMKLRLQGMSQFSGESKYSLATYRDTRFLSTPLLDPEPTAATEVYSANLPKASDDDSAPYLFFLETRQLIDQPGKPTAEDDAAAKSHIKALYFDTQDPQAIPNDLFSLIDNELQFGRSSSSDGTGGLSVPDTHVSVATRRFGPVGDATFNPNRWTGYSADIKKVLFARQRLDYAAYRLTFRKKLDSAPFDQGRTPADVAKLAQSAATLMGFAAIAPPTNVVAFPHFLSAEDADLPPPAEALAALPNLNLGELFGADAQILPGLSFKDLFRTIPLANVPQPAGAPPTASADPLRWNFRFLGLEWLFQLVGNAAGQISLPDLISRSKTEGQGADTSIPVEFGMAADLSWSNDSFADEDLGPIEFIPIDGETHIEIEAHAKIAIGAADLPANLSDLKFSPGNAQVSSRAELKSFKVALFKAIEVEFSSVLFTLSSDGRKDFSTSIANVVLKGPLAFINELSKILSRGGNQSGIQVDISLARVRISQTLKFPPQEGQPLFIGPAQITNLTMGWSVMIPLLGRDVLSVGFALASREKPLTIFVPPWYGGKAHFLLELTTRGIRLLEVSMEYGALIAVAWGPASGQASLTAGVFYMVQRDGDSGKVIFRAFVKADAELDVAGIIHFSGQVYISLEYQEDGPRRLVVGSASVSVSIKIGFVRFSYTFTATHTEEAGSGSPAHAFNRQPDFRASLLRTSDGEILFDDAAPPQLASCVPTFKAAKAEDTELFGPQFDKRRAEAFARIVDRYIS